MALRKRERGNKRLKLEGTIDSSIEEMDPAWMGFDRRDIRNSIADVSNEELKEAIRSGLNQGKQKTRNKRRRRVAARVSVVVMSMVLLLAVFTRVSPVFASVLQDIPLLNKFVHLIDNDSTLRLAAENEFIQSIQVSDTENERTFTVHFILTDGHRLVLFYSLEGEGISKSSRLSNNKIHGVHGEELPAGYTSWSSGDEDNNPAGEKYDKLDIRLQPGMTLPERIMFETEYEQEHFQVEFGIDQSQYASMREEYDVNQMFRIGEQSYRVGHVTVTPLQAEVQIEEMPGNTKQTRGLIGLALVDEQGNRWTSNTGSGSTSYFYSSYYIKPKHLTLAADGAYQVDIGRKLVIDTETLQTIETPDERLQLVDTTPSADGQKLTLTFELNGMDKTEGVKGYSIFDQSKPFTDAAGDDHFLSGELGIMSTQDSSPEHPYSQKITYTIPNKPYKQPLTFELYEYPSYVLQQVKVTIR